MTYERGLRPTVRIADEHTVRSSGGEDPALGAALGADADRLRALVRVQPELNRPGLTSEGAMRAVAEHALQLCDAHGAGIELLEGSELVCRVGVGRLTEREGRRFAPAGTFSGLCLAGAQALLCDDTETDGRVAADAARGAGTRSLAVAPVDCGAGPVGVLKVVSTDAARFDTGDIDSLELLASMLAARLVHGFAEEELREERDTTSAVIEAAGALVVAVDPAGRVVRFNRACELTTGYARSEVVGRHLWDLVLSEADQEQMRDLFGDLRPERVPARFENHWRSREGQQRRIDWSTAVVTGARGEIRLVVGTGIDVTEQRAAEAMVRESEEWLRAIVANVSDIIALINDNAMLLWASPSAEAVLGWDVAARLGRSVMDLIHPEDVQLVADSVIETVSKPGMNLPLQFRMLHANGSYIRVEAVGNNQLDNAAVRGILVTIRDVRERDRIEDWLKGNAEILERVARRDPVQATLDTLARHVDRYIGGPRCAIVLVGGDGRTLRVGAAPGLSLAVCEAIEGISLGEHADPRADVVTDPGWTAFCELVRSLGLNPAWSVPVTASRLEPSLGAVVILAQPEWSISADERRMLELSGRLAAIAVRESVAEAELAYKATHDLLTGLPNRAAFLDSLAGALTRVERRSSMVALLFLDLDGFKEVNDTLGHATGDRLLQVIGERLLAVLRPSDTVARFGGDEFALVCEEIVDEDDARAVAHRVGEAIARPVVLDDHELCVTASVGIALAGGDGHDPDALLRRADQAMYRAKEARAGSFVLQ